MEPKKLILAAVVYTILAQFVHIIGAILSMSYYTDPAYVQVWSKIMMLIGIPVGLGIAWLVEGLIINLVGAAAIVRICEP